MTIFLIPFAGGSSLSFKQWDGNSDKFVFLDYPGKGARAKEALLNTIDELIDDIYTQIVNHIKDNNVSDYLIWGHSMGGCVAYEVVLRMCDKGEVLPKLVIISGSPPPCFDNREEIKAKLQNQDVFLDYLASFGLINDTKVMKRPVFKKLLAAIMNDYILLSEYSASGRVIEGVSGMILHGSEDDSFDVDWKLWSNYFTEECCLKEYPGNHFFILGSYLQIMRDIAILAETTDFF